VEEVTATAVAQAEEEEDAAAGAQAEQTVVTASLAKEEETASAERDEETATDGEKDTTAAITTQAGEDAVLGAERDEETAAAVAQAGVRNTQAESVEGADLSLVVGNDSNVRNTRRSRSTRIPAPMTAALTRSPRTSKAPDRYH